MSKSLGNFVTVHELLTGWQGYAWPGEALRLNMLRTHYRQPLDWTYVGLDEAHKTLWEWYSAVEASAAAPDVPASIFDALSDDLNTPKVIAELHKLHGAGHFESLRAALGLLGFSGERAKIHRRSSSTAEIAVEGGEATYSIGPSESKVGALVAARLDARKAKNFAEADRIRGELEAMGIVLKDAKDPKTGELVTTWEAAR
jgi:cysteinyl-tRNA synthetase